jgi:hypothetical protein
MLMLVYVASHVDASHVAFHVDASHVATHVDASQCRYSC